MTLEKLCKLAEQCDESCKHKNSDGYVDETGVLFVKCPDCGISIMLPANKFIEIFNQCNKSKKES